VTRWIPFALSLAVAAGGIVLLVLGARACDAHKPTRFGPYAITTRVEGEAKYFDLVRDGKVAHTLAGSLDTMCDPPFVARFDIDGGGAPELYFRNCRGHGYLVQRDDSVAYIDEGDGAEPDGWWARQVLGGGRRLIVLGTGLSLAALVNLAIAGARLRPKQ
jgi:hypothetical protein